MNCDNIGTVLVLELEGALTDGTSALASRVQSLVLLQGERAIIISLRHIAHWDDSGLGELILLVIVRQCGGRFWLANAPPRFRDWVISVKFLGPAMADRYHPQA